MSREAIRSMKYGDMPIVIFCYTDKSKNEPTMVSLLNPEENDIKLQCEFFSIYPRPILEMVRNRRHDVHTIVIDVDYIRLKQESGIAWLNEEF